MSGRSPAYPGELPRMTEAWIKRMEQALKEVYDRRTPRVHIFHHNDTDGLTSGAILTRAFERKGYAVSRCALEKPYPAVLRKVFELEGELFVFADFAGRIAPLLSELNHGRNLVLILDHHTAIEATDPKVHNLDPDLFGLRGDLDISASVTCYAFAKLMDLRNTDLAFLAALGAVGDEFFLDGRLVSENRKAVLEAVHQGLVRIEKKEEGEDYLFKNPNGEISGAALSGYLETLGAVGYYQNGPEMAIRVCLQGFSEDSDQVYRTLVSLRKERLDFEIERLKSGGMKETPHLQWFHVQDRLSPMGVKMIGVLCDALKNMDFVRPDKYLAGFQMIPNEIPGFGVIEMNEVKISMRVSRLIEGRIRDGKTLGLNEFLPEATSRLGGFVDACHRLTAATTVAIGKEEKLIEEMETILEPVTPPP
jgi:single-stranded-DNA-specific exonuclease